jgi:molybdenum cofactor guanylyltransferase
MRIAGVIIAGGRSSRMGTEKAFVELGGQPLLQHVIRRISGQVDEIVINANGDANRFSGTGLEVIPDLSRDAATPLAGLRAALQFARDKAFDAVLTVPSDTPFLPHDLCARLSAAQSKAAIASSGAQTHFLTGLWSKCLLEKLEAAMDVETMVRVKDWSKACGTTIVEWPSNPFDPFLNVNTPEELAEAERIATERQI